MRSLVWFRGKDLRVADHGPLAEAAAGGEVIPLFVLDPYFFAPERAQVMAPRMQVLLESLAELSRSLERLGSRLLLVSGRSVDAVPLWAKRWQADQVLAHRWSEPFGRERDARIARALEANGIAFRLFEGETLAPPGSLATQSGTAFSVFTAFARAFRREVHVAGPLPEPTGLPPLPAGLRHEPLAPPALESLGLARNPRLLPGGEQQARARMEAFLGDGLAHYATARDRMDCPGTSRLSADLHFGTLSVRTVWARISEQEGEGPEVFLNELLWREFAHHTLWARQDLLRHPFRPAFEGFPWQDSDKLWSAWAGGRTGYPIVDAAARQLLAEGFVHNRARMVAASFLAKHLLLDFRRGEAHYLAHLADGDWANNDLGWQWSAGCGCDAQPWFRIFNPTLQGVRFDPEGHYVRAWVPELARLPASWIHRPHEAPAEVLRQAALSLGRDYPVPVVSHGLARERFLATAKAHLGR